MSSPRRKPANATSASPCERQGHVIVVGDKGYTGRDFLERHGARTLHGLRARICARFLALAAAISPNHRLGRPPRALADYTA